MAVKERRGEVGDVRHDVSLLSAEDLHLFNEGSHSRLYRKLGAHGVEADDGERGVVFGVWAPGAREVSVIGDFNGWRKGAHPLTARGTSGIWEGFMPGVARGARYKYHIVSHNAGYTVDKADPFGVRQEEPPATASLVWELDHAWGDDAWMAERAERNARDAPISVYEVHLGSWRRPDGTMPTYASIAEELADYVADTGFTHVEFMPLTEHPFYGSWGYQPTGYFAATSRYGDPEDLMALIDRLHQRGIGVILDWVPSHFPTDEHGLGYFDGTHLFEHADPKEGFHPDWNSFIFNYGRHEVRSFLLSSALFWLEHYHIDGIRVDAVASMLYRDYSREAGEWIPNEYGGRENLEAIGFLRRLNEVVYGEYPDVQTIAEESTAWPMVSRPTYLGGLGFGMKWDMGWMHDTLQYASRDPVHRSWHHNEITFRMVYAFNESFMLPLSHDEVVHGKGSILGKMPGDDWRKRANLRALYGWMFAQPGKKLLFMGDEFGQTREWNHDEALEWHLLDDERHEGLRRWVTDLNRLYRSESALHELDFDPAGFEWVEGNDAARSVLAFVRKDAVGNEILAIFNFTPEVYRNYRVGVTRGGIWKEILNSDASTYGGGDQGNMGEVEASPVPYHGRYHSLNLTLPPLACVFFKAEKPESDRADDTPALQAREAPGDPSPEAGGVRRTAGAGKRRPGGAPKGKRGEKGKDLVDDAWTEPELE